MFEHTLLYYHYVKRNAHDEVWIELQARQLQSNVVQEIKLFPATLGYIG
jgi:hypothetical protein